MARSQKLLVRKDFRKEFIEGEDFSEADLRGADFTGARLEHCTFDGADLSFSKGMGLVATNTTFRSANLVYADWPAFHGETTVFSDADLTGAVMPGSFFDHTSFRGHRTRYAAANLSKSVFRDSLWCAAEGRGSCLLDGTDIAGLRRITECFDFLARLVRLLGETNHDGFWIQFAALVRGTSRCEATCWGYFLGLLPDKRQDELFAFARAEFPRSGMITRWKIETARMQHAASGDPEPLSLDLGSGRLAVGDFFGYTNIIQKENPSELEPNVDAMIEDILGEGECDGDLTS